MRQVALVARPGALDHDELLDRHAAERGLALPVVEHRRQLHLRHDALVVGVELGVVLARRRLAADGGEDGAGVDLEALRRLREVDGLDRALLGALAAEGAGVEVDGAHDAAVVELGEDGLLAGLGRLDLAHRLAGPAVDAGVGHHVGQAADAHLEVARGGR